MNNSTDAVKPGHIVSTNAESAAKDVAWPDQAGDVSTGIAGVIPGGDVDTAYAVGAMLPVYLCGGGATVWVRYRTSAGALKAGEMISNGGATIDGLAIPAVDSATPWNRIGRITHWHVDIAAEAWIKVRLNM